MINLYKILIGKAERKGSLGRHKRRWEDNMRMDFKFGKVWTEFIWLWIGTSGGLLLTRY
jgi:hypothetical protein